jgi:hypothetical protein
VPKHVVFIQLLNLISIKAVVVGQSLPTIYSDDDGAVIEISDDDIVMNSSSDLSHNATFHITVITVTCLTFMLPHTGKESGTCYRKLSKHLEIC